MPLESLATGRVTSPPGCSCPLASLRGLGPARAASTAVSRGGGCVRPRAVLGSPQSGLGITPPGREELQQHPPRGPLAVCPQCPSQRLALAPRGPAPPRAVPCLRGRQGRAGVRQAGAGRGGQMEVVASLGSRRPWAEVGASSIQSPAAANLEPLWRDVCQANYQGQQDRGGRSPPAGLCASAITALTPALTRRPPAAWLSPCPLSGAGTLRRVSRPRPRVWPGTLRSGRSPGARPPALVRAGFETGNGLICSSPQPGCPAPARQFSGPQVP